jgi:hypothetical protein
MVFVYATFFRINTELIFISTSYNLFVAIFSKLVLVAFPTRVMVFTFSLI